MDTIEFVQSNIDESAQITPLSMKGKLSPALNSRYGFWRLDLLGSSYLLARSDSSFTIARLAQDFAEIETKTANRVILYNDTCNPYMKRRLISERIPFLLNDKQFYLPFLALNITNSKIQLSQERNIFTPAARSAFLYLLYAEGEAVTQLEIQKALQFSAITTSRVVGELKTLNLIKIKFGGKTNRKQEIIIDDHSKFYAAGMTYFGQAIRKTIYCVGSLDRQLLKSGLAALSEYTMLNPPTHTSYVLHSRNLDSTNMQQVSEEQFLETEGAIRIDLLAYDPSNLTATGIADPVTIMLTLEERDERIDKELDNYMKGFSWYTD